MTFRNQSDRKSRKTDNFTWNVVVNLRSHLYNMRSLDKTDFLALPSNTYLARGQQTCDNKYINVYIYLELNCYVTLKIGGKFENKSEKVLRTCMYLYWFNYRLQPLAFGLSPDPVLWNMRAQKRAQMWSILFPASRAVIGNIKFIAMGRVLVWEGDWRWTVVISDLA